MLERNDMILRDERQGMGNMAQYAPQRQYMPPAPPPEDLEPSLFASVFRHFWIVLIVLGTAIGGAFYYLKHAEPLYTSTSKIYIKPTVARASEIATGERSSALYTEVERIKSTPILKLVLEDPSVKGLPRFGAMKEADQLRSLRMHVDADLGKRDDIISVTMESPDPDESAVIVNSVVQAFIKNRTSLAESSTSGYVQLLQAQLDVQLKKKSDAEEDVKKFYKANPDLALASPGGDSPALQKLLAAQQMLSQLQLQQMDGATTIGPNNPQMQRLKAREAQVDEAMRQAKMEAMAMKDKQLALAQLQALSASVQSTIEPLQRRLTDLQVADDAGKLITPVEVQELGEAPLGPSSPKKANTLALAGVLGLVLGSGLALMRDRMDTRLRTVEEVQQIVGLPILGVVPRMPGRRTAVARAMAVHLDPRAEVAEAYRTIRTAVYFSGQGIGNRAKTLLVTSPEPGDGKTTSASNLAIAIAQTGRNILLLDADFRKPTQHKNLDVKDTVGLSSVLAGIETLDRAIQHTGVDGLDILPCGPIPENPSEILNSQEFGELIDRLALKYDHILFDSPPANLVTDARILGAVCDATILVLRAEKSTRKAAEHARNALLNVGANVIGLIVNDVPRGKGYEVYGGTYYGTPEMRRQRPNSSSGAIAILPKQAQEDAT